MTDKAQQSTCSIGNGIKSSLDPWAIIILFAQGKIDALDIRIIDAIANRGLGKSESARLVGMLESTLRFRLKRIASLLR